MELEQKKLARDHKIVITGAYWRGFKACLVFIVLPIVLIIIATAQIWVNANI